MQIIQQAPIYWPPKFIRSLHFALFNSGFLLFFFNSPFLFPQLYTMCYIVVPQPGIRSVPLAVHVQVLITWLLRGPLMETILNKRLFYYFWKLFRLILLARPAFLGKMLTLQPYIFLTISTYLELIYNNEELL